MQFPYTTMTRVRYSLAIVRPAIRMVFICSRSGVLNVIVFFLSFGPDSSSSDNINAGGTGRASYPFASAENGKQIRNTWYYNTTTSIRIGVSFRRDVADEHVMAERTSTGGASRTTGCLSRTERTVGARALGARETRRAHSRTALPTIRDCLFGGAPPYTPSPAHNPPPARLLPSCRPPVGRRVLRTLVSISRPRTSRANV